MRNSFTGSSVAGSESNGGTPRGKGALTHQLDLALAICDQETGGPHVNSSSSSVISLSSVFDDRRPLQDSDAQQIVPVPLLSMESALVLHEAEGRNMGGSAADMSDDSPRDERGDAIGATTEHQASVRPIDYWYRVCTFKRAWRNTLCWKQVKFAKLCVARTDQIKRNGYRCLFVYRFEKTMSLHRQLACGALQTCISLAHVCEFCQLILSLASSFESCVRCAFVVRSVC